MNAVIEEVAAGARNPALPVDASWFTPEGEGKLEEALSKWEAASESGRFRARRHCARCHSASVTVAPRSRARCRYWRALARSSASGSR